MKIIFFILSIFLLNDCYAQTNTIASLTTDESNLKNFGFTYCLSKADDTALKAEASLAMGGYFQLGNYTEDAYLNIKNHIDKYMAGKNSTYQSTGKPSYLIQCLELYNSLSYFKKVKKQKEFIIKNQ
ncbi:hypothetical protein [Acinetobacter sp. WZC-1]|uniref:hypothetical protein n=1 Tax=Acinetobacter sp. WZC-1 TaxID=3459034 RepID=UPI00403DB3D2